MNITLEITDTEYAILKTHHISPEAWIGNVLREQIRKCANRIFEANTDRQASKVAMPEKLKEIEKLNLKARTDKDDRAVLKHKEKEPKK